jgi:hypothetical protein
LAGSSPFTTPKELPPGPYAGAAQTTFQPGLRIAHCATDILLYKSAAITPSGHLLLARSELLVSLSQKLD